jgi:hypothetical protein
MSAVALSWKPSNRLRVYRYKRVYRAKYPFKYAFHKKPYPIAFIIIAQIFNTSGLYSNETHLVIRDP